MEVPLNPAWRTQRLQTTSERSDAMAEKMMVPVKKAADDRLSRREPFELFNALQEEMGRLWSQPWSLIRPLRRPALKTTAWAPRMDVFEKDGNLVVKAELPGVKKEDIQLTLDRGDLEIRGERKAESEVKEDDYYHVERSYGGFYRRLPLPFEVNAERIQANYSEGVLEISIPRPAEEKPQPHKISVK
jgi:HSP20 family protein